MAKKPFRIKNTSKTYPKIDSKELAKALGADLIASELKVDNNGKEYYQVDIVSGTVRKETRIYRLSVEDLAKNNYKLIGEAEGQDLFHCIYLGGTHTEKFHERVVGFTVSNPTMKDMKVRIAFYEKA